MNVISPASFAKVMVGANDILHGDDNISISDSDSDSNSKSNVTVNIQY